MKKTNNFSRGEKPISLSNSKMENYELNYLKIRPIIASIIGIGELQKIEVSREIRLFLVQLHLKNKLPQITDIVLYSDVYKNSGDNDKFNAIFYELRKFIPSYFIPEYYCIKKKSGDRMINARDKVYNYMQLKNLIILERFTQFQELCLKLSEDKYNRLDDLIILFEKLGDDAKLLFIPEIFNVSNSFLTRELIESVPEILDEETIKRIKLMAYYRDKKKISKLTLDFVFNILLYDNSQSKELINNLSEKIEKIKDYNIKPFNKIISYKSLNSFLIRVNSGDKIGKILQLATNEEPKYLEMIENDSTGWFAEYINNTGNFLSKISKGKAST